MATSLKTPSPFDPEYFYPAIDALYVESWGHPQDESRYYHLWGKAIEQLDYVAFLHVKGTKQFTHAPQRVFRKGTGPHDYNKDYKLRSSNNETLASPTEEDFLAASASSPPASPRTRSQNPVLLSSAELPIPVGYLSEQPSGLDESPPLVIGGSRKRTTAELTLEEEAGGGNSEDSDEASVHSEEPSLSSGNTSMETSPFLDTDPKTRRIPDSTIFVHAGGPNEACYPVIVLENKSLPRRAVLFGTASVQVCRSHWADVNGHFKDAVVWEMNQTRHQAAEQLEALFEDHHVSRVLYIYAVGAFYAAYEVTKEEHNVIFKNTLKVDELQYLFARPDPSDDSAAGNHQGGGREFINWKLNEHLIGLWKKVAGPDW